MPTSKSAIDGRKMHALIVSPIPSDPQDQGNSVRIARMCELLQYYGYHIHFVYYGLEGLTQDQEAAMRRRWDYFHYVPVLHGKPQTGIEGYSIDDFCGPEVADLIQALQLHWRFDLAIVNYVWMSAAIAGIDPSTYTVIDTHDVFGDRHNLLQEQGLAPTWFYCSAQEESRGLDRARAVIAIQNSEAEVLAAHTTRPIHVVGHITAWNGLPPRTGGREPIRVGYLASDNPSNRLSLKALIDAVQAYPEVLKTCRFVIGGRISQRISKGLNGFEAVGFVRDAADFYAGIDLVVNPNVSGTGLKIKNVECLSYGRPLVSTRDGMTGIPTNEPAHLCDTVDAAVALIASLDHAVTGRLADASRLVFRAYRAGQIGAFEGMLASARHHNEAGTAA